MTVAQQAIYVDIYIHLQEVLQISVHQLILMYNVCMHACMCVLLTTNRLAVTQQRRGCTSLQREG
jgi:hypothetical protein